MSHKYTAVVTSNHHTAKRGADIPLLDNEVNQVVYCSALLTMAIKNSPSTNYLTYSINYTNSINYTANDSSS
jgi:hypothetical protein